LPYTALPSRAAANGSETTLSETATGKGANKLLVLGVLVFIVALVNTVYLKSQAYEYFWYRPALAVYGLAVTGYLLSRFAIAASYRRPRDVGFRPAMSVIVACKNEEDAIASTLERIFDAEYPPDLLEVIAIDDGSTDGTYREMERVRDRHPEMRLIRFP